MVNGYNIVAEWCGLLFAFFILFFMFCTRPRATKVYLINFHGIILAIVITCLRIAIFWFSGDVSRCSPAVFFWLCAVFFALYLITTNMLFTYCILLSMRMRLKPRLIILWETVYALLYYFVVFYYLFTGKMYYYADHQIYFTNNFQLPIFFTILTTLFCLAVSIYNRRTIAKVISRYIYFFIPLELALLIAQLLLPKIAFLSLTYVLPFSTFYILFHNNPYDEVSGTQNNSSFETNFRHSISFRNKYAIVYATFSRIKNDDHNFTQEQINAIASAKCRQIEAISSGISLYTLKDYNYAAFTSYTDEAHFEYLVKQIITILEEPFYYNDAVRLTPHFKAVAFHDNPYVTTLSTLRSMQNFLFSKVNHVPSSRYHICSKEDYEEFGQQYKIEQLLINIKNKRDLDDSRVLCYAQPIYDVKTKSFRTAETLMRLFTDGKILYPDKFIFLAEQHNCLHVLTCIMLNKICQLIKEMEHTHEFDAITINCSTFELSSAFFYQELLDIISSNYVDCSKIRMELTESAFVNDYANLLLNMKKLNKAGIRFYLDDFGTGYSNFERILNCPFMTIKFDKSLLYKSIDDTYLDDLLTNMVRIFKRKGMVTLIEGVEDEKQNKFCVEKGFDYIQGYLYAKPVPAEELTSYFLTSEILL